MKRTMFHVLIAAGLVTALTMLSGCGVTAGKVRRNMTPALDSTDASGQQSHNDVARAVDHNTRTAWDDFKRVMLIDDPSTLHRYPIP